GRRDQPARNLDPRRIRLALADQAGGTIAHNLVELVPVDRDIAAPGRRLPPAERPQHRKNRGGGHQRQDEPESHGSGYITPAASSQRPVWRPIVASRSGDRPLRHPLSGQTEERRLKPVPPPAPSIPPRARPAPRCPARRPPPPWSEAPHNPAQRRARRTA